MGVGDVVEEALPASESEVAEKSLTAVHAPLPAELDDPAVTDAVTSYQAQVIQNHAPAQLKLGLDYHVGRNAQHQRLRRGHCESQAGMFLGDAVEVGGGSQRRAVSAILHTVDPDGSSCGCRAGLCRSCSEHK